MLEGLWLAHRLAPGRVAPDPAEADPGAPPRFLTSVLRLPEPVTEALVRSATDLGGALDGHHVYPVDSIHVTLANATGLDDRERAGADLRRIAETLVGNEATVVGLGMSRWTVFAAIAPDDALRRARAELRRSWSDAVRPGLAGRLAGRLWYANLVRFRGVPSRDLGERLRAIRHVPVSTVSFSRLELVRTNKVMALEATTVLEAWDLTLPGRTGEA